MKKLFTLMVALILLLPNSAQASFWVECKVKAVLHETKEAGLYKADIKSAVVTDGYSTKGDPCMEGNIGKTIEINLTGDIPTGKQVRLKYNFYNAMGEDGVVNEESWEYWPVSMKDMLPW